MKTNFQSQKHHFGAYLKYFQVQQAPLLRVNLKRFQFQKSTTLGLNLKCFGCREKQHFSRNEPTFPMFLYTVNPNIWNTTGQCFRILRSYVNFFFFKKSHSYHIICKFRNQIERHNFTQLLNLGKGIFASYRTPPSPTPKARCRTTSHTFSESARRSSTCSRPLSLQCACPMQTALVCSGPFPCWNTCWITVSVHLAGLSIDNASLSPTQASRASASGTNLFGSFFVAHMLRSSRWRAFVWRCRAAGYACHKCFAKLRGRFRAWRGQQFCNTYSCLVFFPGMADLTFRRSFFFFV